MLISALHGRWRFLVAGLLLALIGAACQGQPVQPPPATQSLAAPALASAGQTQVEAWAVATGTALRLTANAALTATPKPVASVTYRPTSTATGTPLPSPAATTAPAPSPQVTRVAEPTLGSAPTAIAASATPSNQDCYAKECQRLLVSPDGQRTWPETCMNLGLDMDCYITFPNGQKTVNFRWGVTWSADGKFLLVPNGGSHDSLPGGYEVWNMTTSARVTAVGVSSNRLMWSPTGHALAYVKSLTYPEQEFWLLDAATGEQQATRQCPEWATRQITLDAKGDWQKLCDNWTPPAGQPIILSFTVEPQEATPGDTVTLTWSSANASAARLEARSASSAPTTLGEMPPSGSLTVTIGRGEQGAYIVSLSVTDDAGQMDLRSQMVMLRCLDAFFFATSTAPIAGGCPYRPAAFVAAVEQAFENGRMLWLAPVPAQNTASGAGQGASIYVLYNAGVMDIWGVWQRYDDLWAAGQPESDPALEPPAGLVQPVRGFGRVWRDAPNLRAKLGWATGPEQSFDGAFQVQAHLGSPPGEVYLRAADRSILNLRLDSYWDVQP